MLEKVILLIGFSRQEYWSGLPFPSPVDHILSDLSTMTHPSWVVPRLSFIELDKAVVCVIKLASCLLLWFHSVCPDAFSLCLPSYLGFSYLKRGVSLYGCSRNVQPLLLTLDVGKLLSAATDLGHGVAPLSCRPWPWMMDHWKSKRVPGKLFLFLLYWLCQSLWLCGSQ